MENGRLPRLARAEGNARPPLRLTLRDVATIEAVWRYRALTTPQLAALHFNGAAQGVRICQRRLQRLYHHEYLARVEQQGLRSEGSKPFVYLLDEAGALCLVRELGIEPEALDWHPRGNEVGWSFLDHHLSTNDVRIAIEQAARVHGWVIARWIDDKALRSRQMKDVVTLTGSEGRSERAAVVPDGYFRLATAGDAYNCFIEIDKRTVTGEASVWGRRDWSRKIKVYLVYYNSGSYERRYGTADMRVLTVTTGERRRDNLREIASKVAGAQAPRFWFSTFGQVVPETVLTAPIWAVAGKDGLHSLIAV